MKRVIVIVLVLLLVAGGGAGGLIMLGIVPNPFNPKVPLALTDAEKAAKAASEHKFKGPQSAYTFIKIPDMIVPVIIDGEVRRRVFITAKVMAGQASDKAAITGNMQAFQNALLGDLVPFFQNYYLSHDMLDINLVKEKLNAHAKEIFGDAAKDVLLVNVFDQGSGPIPSAQ